MVRKTKGNRQEFIEQRNILDFRPRIEFVEPDQIEGEPPPVVPAPTIDEIKSRVKNVIDSYREIEQLADVAQDRIDQRSQDFAINLDSKVDGHIIEAIKRQFPDKADPTVITFDDYKKSMRAINEHAESKVSVVDPEEQLKALGDLYRTDFGGLGKKDGLNRPELDPASQVIEPINIPEFQVKQVAKLFQQMTSMTTDLIKSIVPGV